MTSRNVRHNLGSSAQFVFSLGFFQFMSEFQTVAKVGSIPPGTGRAFPVDGRVIAVFNDQGTYRAIDDFCPHMGASLASGDLEDSIVTCPWHAWRFDTRDGTWCDNRKIKISSYEVRLLGDDIQIKVEKPTKPASDHPPALAQPDAAQPDAAQPDAAQPDAACDRAGKSCS
jgi:nitrite reductase (NADH) small subunit/3-phenylpropionate/trans-cinnamate dioxygenase ferredoxin subunit